MKRRLSTIIAICAVALLAASCNSDKFTIKADIAHLADQKVFLNRPGLHGLEPVDTAEAVDGKFIFKGKLETNDYRIITFEDVSGEIDLYMDNSNIKVEGDYVALDSVKVKGSPAMDYYMKFAEIAKVHNDYVKSNFDNPELVEIDSITGYADKNGGILVHFTYKCWTEDGKFVTERGSLYLVVGTITIDISQFKFNCSNELKYQYNGKSVEKGFSIREINDPLSGVNAEQRGILSIWIEYQTTSKADVYNLDRINKAIK
jgi:hypothetical protein